MTKDPAHSRRVLRHGVELRGFEPLTPSMPWRCATNCATAPGGVPPEGATVSLPMTPRARPNRPQGGEDPGRAATPDDAFHVWSRHPARPSSQLGPVAVAESAEHPPGELEVEAEQPERHGASRRTVRGHDGALPRRQVRQQLLERPRPRGRARPASTRRPHLGARPRRAAPPPAPRASARRPPRRVSPCQRPGVDLAEARVQLDAGCRTRAPRSRPSAGRATGRR